MKGDKVKPFVKLDLDLLADPTVSTTAKLVYGRMQLYACKSGDCYASMETIATDCGISAATVKRAIKKLRSLGWIQVISETTGSTIHYAVKPYVGSGINLTQPPVSNCTTHQYQNDTRTSVKMIPNIDNTNKKNRNRQFDEDDVVIVNEHNFFEKPNHQESRAESLTEPLTGSGSSVAASSMGVQLVAGGPAAAALTDAILQDCSAFSAWLYKRFRTATGVRRLYRVNPERDRDGGRFENIRIALCGCFDVATVEKLVEKHLAGFRSNMTTDSAKDYLSISGFEETVLIEAPSIQAELRAAEEAAAEAEAKVITERPVVSQNIQKETRVENPKWTRWQEYSGYADCRSRGLGPEPPRWLDP